jgi:hypothetical protein
MEGKTPPGIEVEKPLPDAARTQVKTSIGFVPLPLHQLRR